MFLIDGYNLLHAMTRGKAREAARDQLIGLIETFCARGNYRARIVFDPTGGMARRNVRGDVEILSAAQGQTADEIIIDAIEDSGDRTEFTVVSNDRSIVTAAGKKRMEVMECEEFARRLAERTGGEEKSDAVPPGEVDYWLREFGLDDD